MKALSVCRTLLAVGLSWLLPQGACAADRIGVSDVIVVFKTHFDIGYTDMASNVVQRYRTTMIQEALKVVEQNRDLPPQQRFVWTLPGWPLSKIAEDWEGQTQAVKQQVQAAFKEGRFVVHALPFTTHTELLELEDLVRGLGFSSRLSREAGLELPRDAKMTDVPCHSWVLPTLLRGAGVDFLHLGCNAASSSPQIPVLFWWEGPDGSRLLTMYTAESYGTGLVPPANWPHKAWLALIHTGDNHGPPTPEEVRKLLEEARQRLPGVRVRVGRLSDFADAIVASGAILPVVRGDMPDTWIHGPLCDPGGAILARRTRPALTSVEALNTQLRVWGAQAIDSRGQVDRAFEQSLLYGEHTWGGALYWVTKYDDAQRMAYGDEWRSLRSKGRFERLEASWEEHTSYIKKAAELTTSLVEQDLKVLAGAVQGQGPKFIVYNPLPWKRNGVATVRPDKGSVVPAALDGGSDLAAVAWDGEQLRFMARGVPPMGYKTYVPTTKRVKSRLLRADTSVKTIENDFFKVTLDAARGAVRSLLDKHSKRELVDAAAPHGFGQYLYERFDAAQVSEYVAAYVKIKAAWATNELGKPNLAPPAEAPYRGVSPTNCDLTFEQTPLSVSAVMRAVAGPGLPHGVTTRVTVYAEAACVDLEITVHDKPADPWPEAGWICLPFKIDQPQFRLGRPGSIVDPAREILAGANRHLMGLTTGLTINDPQGRGVGLCPIDSPLVSLDSPGCWKYSTDFVPRRPRACVNLFNNQWTTNFRLWNQGSWTWRVRVWTFDHYAAEPSLITPALEARFPLLAAFDNGTHSGPRNLPAIRHGLELSRPGVLVTAFGPNPDGDGIALRLWEHAGESGTCRVRLPDGMRVTEIQPVDLRGRPVGKAMRADRSFEALMRAFAPASFVLK